MTKIDSSLFEHGHEAISHAFGDCPNCQSPLRILKGKNGKFLGCTTYPKCEYSQPLHKNATVDIIKVIEGSICPDCEHELAVKKGRYGMFIGCTNFPECHYINVDKPTKQSSAPISCPQCQRGTLVQRNNKTGKIFYSCDAYPKCKYILNDKPVGEACPQCHWSILVEKPSPSGVVLSCPVKSCHFESVKPL